MSAKADRARLTKRTSPSRIEGLVRFVISTERVGEQKEIPGTSSTFSNYNRSFMSVTGFAASGVNDRTEYIGTDKYRIASNEKEFLQAITDASKGKVKVIEIKNDLSLGYNELSKEEQAFSCIDKYSDIAYTNPILEKSGVSQLSFSNIDGLTVFSQNGATIKHVTFKLSPGSNDLVFRNLKFDEMWQWDRTGRHKEAGWTFIKVNGATNVWIDHCTFTIAADGNVDIENGSSGVTMSWCKFGLPSEVPDESDAIYKTIMNMEEQYQSGKINNSRYAKLREGGASPESIMQYEACHSKVHLVGSGDKDYKDGEGKSDGNQRLQLTLAYNQYINVCQRVPMIRQGQGHMFNCYVDDMGHASLHKQEPFSEFGYLGTTRCIDARNGASIGADTCVFYGVNQPVTGAEKQCNSSNNASPYDSLFSDTYNHVLVVNSRTTNTDGITYEGSSWDNNGQNQFNVDYRWSTDRPTINNWIWKSSIKGIKDKYTNAFYSVDEMEKADPMLIQKKDENGELVFNDSGEPVYEPFVIEYDEDAVLPYEYQLVTLDAVKSTVQEHGGAYSYNMSAEDWLRINYDAVEK